MARQLLYRNTRRNITNVNQQQTLGFIGLGNMGYPMAHNLVNAGYELVCYDVNQENTEKLSTLPTVQAGTSVAQVAQKTSRIITVLPNDKVLQQVSNELLQNLQPGGMHISCSTVSPNTSRELSAKHNTNLCAYVTAPIFARPDGMADMQANFVMSGKTDYLESAKEILSHTSAGLYYFGEDAGAANVVKLCGNFLIASAIESMAEACALAESNGVDRVDAIKFYSSTFLNSVIYQGYGQRVSERDHRPGGFSLELGLKDMSLVKVAAHESKTPMPFLSVLLDRFLSEKAKGRANLDWSAIGLGVSENCGVDVSKGVEWSSKSTEKEGMQPKECSGSA